jgi:hypothetical protein
MATQNPTTNNQDSSMTNKDVLDNVSYSPSDLEYFKAIEQESAQLFPPEKQFPAVADLRNSLSLFASKKGFSMATDGCKILCSRS